LFYSDITVVITLQHINIMSGGPCL